MARRIPDIHERFLRYIWNNKYFAPVLHTVDGRRVEICDVGVPNSGAGPDFLHSHIILDGVHYRGDVEIHRTPIEWVQHSHHFNPRYNSVILHVVLDDPSNESATTTISGRGVPVVILSRYLTKPLRVLWEQAILDERASRRCTFPCSQSIEHISPETLEQVLFHLSMERLELKLRRFEERLTELAFVGKQFLAEQGCVYISEEEMSTIPPANLSITKKDVAKRELWEQLLYEGIMEALGYSSNREPFRRLAQYVPLSFIRQNVLKHQRITLEALLFGVGGLLPEDALHGDPEAQHYGRELREQWNQFSRYYRGDVVNRSEWNSVPTRPANFPERRLGIASALTEKLCRDDVFRTVIQLLKHEDDVDYIQRSFNDILSVELHPFWKYHYNFTSKSSRPLQALGVARRHEIIVNIFLPVALLYARTFKDRTVRAGCIKVYSSLPARENNRILRTMEQEIVRGKIRIDTVCKQQGLIQLYKYYCCENKCSECTIQSHATAQEERKTTKMKPR